MIHPKIGWGDPDTFAATLRRVLTENDSRRWPRSS